MDSQLIDSLASLPQLRSVQPYLMAAFNTRRQHFGEHAAWFVLHEPKRLTLSLIAEGRWRLIRTRQIRGDWRASLADLLEREVSIDSEISCHRVLLWSEDDPPAAIGRYAVTDVTLAGGAPTELRQYALALN